MEVCDCDKVKDQLWTVLDILGCLYENQVIMKVDPKGTFVAEDPTTGTMLNYSNYS